MSWIMNVHYPQQTSGDCIFIYRALKFQKKASVFPKCNVLASLTSFSHSKMSIPFVLNSTDTDMITLLFTVLLDVCSYDTSLDRCKNSTNR